MSTCAQYRCHARSGRWPTGTVPCTRRTRGRDRDRGSALAVVLLLMPVATLIGVSAMMTATLELRMAANAQVQERAFQAAEFAIEQALGSTDFSTGYTLSSPKLVPSAGVPPAVPGSASDTYSYRLYFDPAPDGAGTPKEAAEAGLVAYHFIIEAAGSSARGARDTHVQGFYVLHPPGWTGATTSTCDPADCTGLPASAPERTFWRQQDAE